MKLNKIIMAVIMVFTLLFVPNVFAAEDIEIKNITKVGKSDNATYAEHPEVNGLTISFNGVTFKDPGDYVIYKAEVVNNSNEDYEINNGTSFSDSKYFKYEFNFNDSNLVTKKSSKEMTIKISYDKEVPTSAMKDDGTFTETNNMTINLTNKVVASGNPKTGSGLVVTLLIVFLAVTASISMILTSKTKLNKHFIMIIALALAVIPTTIYAAKVVTIKLDTEILIDKNYHFYFAYEDNYCSENATPQSLNEGKASSKLAQNPLVDFIDDECNEDYLVEEYSFRDANVTWEEVLQFWDEDPSMVDEIFAQGSNTSVKLTDKLINGMTYTWKLYK